MSKVLNGVWKKIMVFLLTLSVIFSGAGINAQAAANKALCVKFSFNGQNYEDNGDDCWYNNGYSIALSGTSKKTALKNLKISAVFYIPKTALKKGLSIDFSPYIDVLDSDGEFIGSLGSKVFVSVVNEGGKVKLYGCSNQTGKSVKASKYATCKAGTGKYKSYYVLKLKNIPMLNTIYIPDGKTITVKSSTKYAFNVGCSFCGQNKKSSGKLYLDNVQVTSGKKKVVNITFSSKPSLYTCFYKEKELGKKKVSIVTF